MLPEEIAVRLPVLFSHHLGEDFYLRSTNMLAGGSINNALLLKTNLGDFFIKYNLSAKYPEMFEKEAMGLELLDNACALRTPKVLFTDSGLKYSFIVMEFIQSGYMSDSFWKSFASGLARLHRNHHDKAGLDHNNYIGSLFQDNEYHTSWNEFFILKRLLPLIKDGRNAGLLNDGDTKAFERLFNQLPSIFPQEPLSLLHGDLWNGNILADTFHEPFIFDPAVYYGFREMDIAMSRLFGGFPDIFYATYNEYFPLENEWEERMDICNLYPLLVHLKLFGGSYALSLKSIISRF